jgi:hypothetical protein
MIADAARTMAASRTVLPQCRPAVAAGLARLGIPGLVRVWLVTVSDG